MKNKNKLLLGVFAVVGAFAGHLAATAELSTEKEPLARHVMRVPLSEDAAKRRTQLHVLSTYDVHGKDRYANEVRVSLNEQEIAELESQGFDLLPLVATENFADIAKYHNPDKLVATLDKLAAEHPSLVRVFDIGSTHKGRALKAVEINSDMANTNKPAILFNAMHHARELMTTEVALHIVQTLANNYGSDDEVTSWLDNYRVFVVPQVNPDGNELVHSSARMWRKNAWSENNRVIGVDLNRNYPAYWNHCNGSSGNKSNDTYRGPHASSEPEVKAMMSLVEEIRPVFNISYHSYSELILYPFGCSNVKNNSKELYKKIANEMRASVVDDSGRTNTYEVGAPPDILYSADGGDMDWQWRDVGVISFAFEINSSSLGFQPDFDKWREKTVQRQEGGWKTLLRNMSKNVVRAQISAEDLSQVTYTIETLHSVNDAPQPWAEPNVKPFRLRSDEGLFYQVVGAGTYKVSFFKEGTLVKSINFAVNQNTVDLGTLVF